MEPRPLDYSSELRRYDKLQQISIQIMDSSLYWPSEPDPWRVLGLFA